MSLDNIIIPITTFDSYNYSTLVSNLLSFSPSVANQAADIGNMHVNIAYYNKDGNVNYTIRKDTKEISKNPKAAVTKLTEYMSEIYDNQGNSIINSDKIYILSESIKSSIVKSIGARKIYADYTDVEYIGFLESMNTQSYSEFTLFNYTLTAMDIDRIVRFELPGKYVNLHDSSNFCRTLLEFIAEVNNQKVDIDDAMLFFYNQPVRYIKNAIRYGMIETMMSGHNETLSFSNTEYTPSGQQTDNNTVNIKIKNLVTPDFTLSKRTMSMVCHRLNIEFNEQLFKSWHDYMFDVPRTDDEEIKNIICKISTGAPYSEKRWDSQMQHVFDFYKKK